MEIVERIAIVGFFFLTVEIIAVGFADLFVSKEMYQVQESIDSYCLKQIDLVREM